MLYHHQILLVGLLLSGGVNNLVRSFPGTIVGCIVAFVVTFILYGEKNLENS